MGERFSGESFEGSLQRERDPLLEARETITKIDILIAKLVEQGDLSLTIKQSLRAQIGALLASLGLSDTSQLIDFSRTLYQQVSDRLVNPQTPSGYPDRDEFARSLKRVLGEPKPRNLPHVWTGILASEVARFGQVDWSSIQGRGGVSVLEYHYNLGKVLCDELVYAMVFKAGDEIKIQDNWQIENGRHRTLVLRTLGEYFIRSVGLDDWVKVEKGD